MRTSTRPLDRLLAMGLFLVIGAGCGQSASCGCGDNAPYPAEGLVVHQGMQLRLTPSGIETLEEAVVPMILDAMGGESIGVCIPANSSSYPNYCHNNITCDDGSAGCQLDMRITDVNILPQDRGPGTAGASPPDAIRAVVHVGELDSNITFRVLLANCNAHVYLNGNDTIQLATNLAMRVDGNSERLSLVREGININADKLRVDISGGVSCWFADLFSGMITDMMIGQMEPEIEAALDSFLCIPCAEGCPPGTTCNQSSGLCMAGTQCAARPLGAEGRFDVADILASLAGGMGGGAAKSRWIHYLMHTGNYADAIGQGLSIGMQAGMTSFHHRCVPYQPPPPADRIPRSTILEAEPSPGGHPFAAAIGVSRSFLDHALWAAYNTGALCIEVTSAAMPELNTSMLAFLLQSLNNLTDSEARPLLIKVSPRQAPTATLGAGRVDFDPATQTYTLVEPLITVHLHDVDIDLFGFFFERYARFLTVNADLDLPLALVVTPDNGLLPVIGSLDGAITRLQVRNMEILSESPALMESLLPGLIGAFLPDLAGAIAEPFLLPEVMGFELDVKEIISIENESLLGIFAGLQYSTAGALSVAVKTSATLRQVDLPIVRLLDPRGRVEWSRFTGDHHDLWPTAEIAVAAEVPAQWRDAEMEFSYRIGRSLWSVFQPGPLLRVRHPALLFPGRHVIEVRARPVGHYRALDPTPAQVLVDVDWTPPHIEAVELLVDGSDGVIIARDDVSRATELRYRTQINDGDWSAWSESPRFALTGQGRLRVRAEVQDRAGNVARHTAAIEVGAGLLPVDPQTMPSDCTCTMRRGSELPPWGVLICAALLALLGWRRPWRRWLGALLALVVAGLPLACDDAVRVVENVEVIDDLQDTGGDQLEVDGDLDPDACGPCDDGYHCEGGRCVITHLCEPGTCGPGEVCREDEEGRRVCRFEGCHDRDTCDMSCEEGLIPLCVDYACVCGEPCEGGCATGSFCCHLSNACQELPEACAGVVCEPGFRLVVEGVTEGVSATCEISEATCLCQKLPPLPMGRFGTYTAAATADDRVLFSAYNSHYGDLMVGVLDDDDAIHWSFVDGVPWDAPVEGATDGPRGGIRQRGENVGRHTDIAVGAEGVAHLSYQDVDHSALRYARGVPADDGTWTWSVMTVDALGRGGYWTSISLHPVTGAPGIAAMTVSHRDDGVFYAELRYAQASSADPQSAADWQVSTLDRVPIAFPCGLPCPEGTLCRASLGVCEASAPAASCGGACPAGERCFADGACDHVLELMVPSDWPRGVGLFSAQARYADGRVLVVYYDSVAGNLRGVRQNSDGTFAPPFTIAGEEGGVDTGNLGLWPSVAIDDVGMEHLSFVDWDEKRLLYRKLDGSAIEVVDDGLRADLWGFGVNVVGADASIHIVNGVPTIVYQDASALQLNIAERQEGGFVQEILAGAGRESTYTGAWGFFSDHVMARGALYVINFVVNQQSSPTTFRPELVRSVR